MILALHKPWGVLCQFTPDLPGQRTLADFGLPKDVWPVGRLDMDSEGLLLLSDEKKLVDRLLHPRHGHSKTYHVQVEGIPDPEALRRLTDGSLVIKGHRCAPAEALVLDPQPEHPPRDPPIRVRRNIPERWISITLTEGKNRQVRRMTAAVNLPTLRLIRVAIGRFKAPELAPGEWRELDSADRPRLEIP